MDGVILFMSRDHGVMSRFNILGLIPQYNILYFNITANALILKEVKKEKEKKDYSSYKIFGYI